MRSGAVTINGRKGMTDYVKETEAGWWLVTRAFSFRRRWRQTLIRLRPGGVASGQLIYASA